MVTDYIKVRLRGENLRKVDFRLGILTLTSDCVVVELNI